MKVHENSQVIKDIIDNCEIVSSGVLVRRKDGSLDLRDLEKAVAKHTGRLARSDLVVYFSYSPTKEAINREPWRFEIYKENPKQD